jgi:hypothetical protein
MGKGKLGLEKTTMGTDERDRVMYLVPIYHCYVRPHNGICREGWISHIRSLAMVVHTLESLEQPNCLASWGRQIIQCA